MKFKITLSIGAILCLTNCIRAQIPKTTGLSPTAFEKLYRLQIEAKAATEIKRQEFIKTDKQLDSAFNAVVNAYKTDTAFVSHFSESQHLWKLLLKSDIKAQYPDETPNAYGQSYLDCIYQILIDRTKGRIEFVNQWLKGIPEGDVCSGSIKMLK